MRRPFYYLFITALIVLVGNNFRMIFDLIGHTKFLFGQPVDFTENSLRPLRWSLNNILVAGFYTDFNGPFSESNLLYQYPFEQIKMALTPTILDRYHPLDHQYIVIYLKNPGSWEKILLNFPKAKLLAKVGEHLILIKRDRI